MSYLPLPGEFVRKSHPLDAYGRAHFIADFARGYYRNGLSRARVNRIANLAGLTFTRAGVKWAQPSGGDWKSFASGVPAIITSRGISIEGARTALSKRSRRLDDTSYWTLSSMTTSTVQGVDGVSGSATRLTASGANATALGFANTAGSAACRLAPFIRRIAGTGNIDLTLDGGSTWTTVSATSLYTRLPIGQTLANPRVGIRIVSSGDSVDIDFANGETGAFDSSPIESDTGLVTRPADVCSIAVSGLAYPLTMFARIERVVDTGGSEDYFDIRATDNNNRTRIGVNGSDLAFVQVNQGGADQGSVTVAGSMAVATPYKMAARVNTNSIQIARGGTLGTEDTTATLPTTPNEVRLGQGNTPFGYISQAAIWSNLAFSDANLQGVTS